MCASFRCAFFLGCLLLSGCRSLPPVQSTRLPLRTCEVPGVEGVTFCGTYSVYEDREAQRGRKIPLNIVVLAALDRAVKPDPLFFLSGGPGQAATRGARFIANAFRRVRMDRDIVLVDQRGTGHSHPLQCGFAGTVRPRDLLGDFLPPAAVRACRDELQNEANLAMYTTPAAIDDLDEVRAWLGYTKINLYGTSYGSRAALVYLRQHPSSVRSAVLKGVAPLGLRMPLNYPSDMDRSVKLLFEACAADPSCAAAYPSLPSELDELLGRLKQQPAHVSIEGQSASLSSAAFLEGIRNVLYSVDTAVRVPSIVHRAWQGDFEPFIRLAARQRRAMYDEISLGLFLSVTCSEDLPFIREEEAAGASAGTLLGDYRYRQQAAACSAWVQSKLPPDYTKPVVSSTPVLLISGNFDPVTPPRWGELAARTLPNSRHIVFPQGSHGFGAVGGCLDRMIAGFIGSGSAQGVDSGCVEKLRMPSFEVSTLL
jgi:pimeloyl-ACP methyl ester carboxylesterase